MADLSQLTVKELLEMASRAEIEANKTYAGLADSIKNPLLKEKFQWLAFEENKHRESLLKLFQSLYREEKMEIPEQTDQILLPSIHFTPDSSLADILFQAMKAEKAAEEFYSSLARKVDNPQHRILDYLSHVEHSHHAMLKSEYTMALEFEDYGEQDIEKVVT